MHFRLEKWGLCAALMTFLFVHSLSARAGVIDDVRVQLAQNSYSAAEAELRDYKAQHGVTPEYLEALSWMARGAASLGQWSQATAYASQTRSLAEHELVKRRVDAEPHLPIALGAAYETLAEAMAEKGQRAQAVSLLRSALTRYGNTSIRGGCRRTSTCYRWSADQRRPYKRHSI